jgi:CBS domain-containing protein
MPDLSLQKKAQRLRIYIGESDRWRSKPLDTVLLEMLRARGMAGATVFRGAAGFGAHSRIRSVSIEVLSMDLPVVIEVVDAPEKITAVLEVIYPMVREGLITVEDVQIVKYTHRFLNPLPADKLVSEVMTRTVVSLTPDMPIHQAWKQMLEKVIKAAPVVDAAGKVVGILTNEDLLDRAGVQQRLSVAIRMDAAEINHELQSLQTSPLKVADVMTQPVISVLESEALGVATSQMVKANLKRLPVVDATGQLVGILSRLDILRQVADSPHVTRLTHGPVGAMRTVSDIMTSDIPMVNQDDDLPTLIEKFSQSDSYRLIVVDSDGKAIGLVSDSDVVSRIQPAKRRSILNALRRLGKPPAGKETAFDLMSPGLLTAPADLPVVEAVQKMLAEGRKWLVVTTDQGKPLGLVDRQILLESFASFFITSQP